MKQTFSDETLTEVYAELENHRSDFACETSNARNPVHVVYGGAHLFKADTPEKLGKIARRALEEYAADFVEFAHAMWLPGAESLPQHEDAARNLEFDLTENAEKVKKENFAAWLAWTVYQRTAAKLLSEAVEDYRIDFEDGYGFRADDEEDAHAIAASGALAEAFLTGKITAFCGFRVKSLQTETRRRAIRTLDLFLTNLLGKTGGKLPENFVVTLPKISRREEVAALARLLSEFENRHALPNGAFKIEIMIETPQAIVSENGNINLRGLVEAGGGRVNSAHFGAYDYTASFNIAGTHQHLQHEACVFARQMMQIALAPLNLRLADSVTTEMPVPVHRGENLSATQKSENRRAVHAAWRRHFNNVTKSLINGFYQSWDLHPAQIVARYAAVYAFFLTSADAQSQRLKGFVEKATRANLTGNTFDDAASAHGLLNFFRQGLNCGAFTENEISEKIGLSAEQLRAASFAALIEQKTNGENY